VVRPAGRNPVAGLAGNTSKCWRQVSSTFSHGRGRPFPTWGPAARHNEWSRRTAKTSCRSGIGHAQCPQAAVGLVHRTHCHRRRIPCVDPAAPLAHRPGSLPPAYRVAHSRTRATAARTRRACQSWPGRSWVRQSWADRAAPIGLTRPSPERDSNRPGRDRGCRAALPMLLRRADVLATS